MPSFTDRLKHGWNAFMNKDPTPYYSYGTGYSINPDRPRFTRGNERSIIGPIINRIALDAASIKVLHAKFDDEDRFIEIMDSGLNNCLTVEANIDQTGRSFLFDAIVSMMDDGVVGIVPIDTSLNPKLTGSYDIDTMRVAKILQWYPQHVRIKVYNDKTGKHEEIVVPKSIICIIENPWYSVMNEPNSIAQRLINKLNLLDVIDNQSGSGKLDLIIQLPYIIKTQARRQQAENRRKDIENQLSNSKYGIAYTDGTERITQLNRPVDNNLMSQIEYLTSMLMSQLNLTAEIMNGTADENTMNNYFTRTIEPILSAIVDEMTRKFLTKTARTQHQKVCFFRDPFRLMPISSLAEVVDKFTRNEIMTGNEIRQKIGMHPSDDPTADELRNKNLSASKDEEIQIDEQINTGGNNQNAK